MIAAIGAGTASIEVVKRYAKGLYYLGLWMTPEFALLVARAPDRYGLTMEHSEHYAHWCQNFADEAGFLGDPNHVLMKVEHCHQLGITDDELRAYVPMPETVGSVYTLAYYCRSSYEEGLAAFGYARERVAGLSGYAKTVYTGLSKYYGIKAKNFEVHSYAEEQHGDQALELLRNPLHHISWNGDREKKHRERKQFNDLLVKAVKDYSKCVADPSTIFLLSL